MMIERLRRVTQKKKAQRTNKNLYLKLIQMIERLRRDQARSKDKHRSNFQVLVQVYWVGSLVRLVLCLLRTQQGQAKQCCISARGARLSAD